jgi:hypothetical protein
MLSNSDVKSAIQDYSHDLLNKLDKIHKKDPKAIKDRDVAIRNQFAENVRGPWLRRDLKKRIRDQPDLTFTDIREEATLLIQDKDSDQQQVDQFLLSALIEIRQQLGQSQPLTKYIFQNLQNCARCLLIRCCAIPELFFGRPF